MADLTRREVTAARRCSEGATDKTIAEELGCNIDGAKGAVSRALEKTGNADRHQLGLYAYAVDRACQSLREADNG